MTRNIGIPITVPKKECTDKHCPFHGILSIRGKLFEGKVVSAKAKNTIVLQKESLVYFTKFKRYARSKNTIHAYKPSCIDVEEGDLVLTGECRPISKSVSFVVVEVKK
ncbi:MAG: 30S ribosomal protein S17 [Nitrosopumilales archaeon]|nr:MAG: 30S ribosomal protein S17 [Nitrosopumilales archaeon]